MGRVGAGGSREGSIGTRVCRITVVTLALNRELLVLEGLGVESGGWEDEDDVDAIAVELEGHSLPGILATFCLGGA